MNLSPTVKPKSRSTIIKHHINNIYSEFIIKTDNFNDLFDKYIFTYNPTFDTASWRYLFPDTHQIVIGDVVGKHTVANIQEKIIRDYLYHELSHSVYTDKDMDFIQAKLIQSKINFRLYNLFEDARVESLWTKDFNHKFNWDQFEKINPKSPDAVFYKIIQTGNRGNALYGVERNLFLAVRKYYEEAILAHDIDVMVDIIVRFKEEFEIEELSDEFELFSRPSDEIDDNKRDGNIKIESDDGEDNGSKADIFAIENLQVVEIVGVKREGNIRGKNQDFLDSIGSVVVDGKKEAIEGVYDFIKHSVKNQKDDDLVSKIVSMMDKIFKSRKYNNTPSYRGKRINPTRMVLDSDKVFNVSNIVKNKSRLKLTLIVDMSGSMEIIEYETMNIVYAMNEMSKTSYFDTTLLLSSDEGYQKIKLPCEEEIIDNLDFASMGGEGIENTLSHNIKLLQDSKNIIVITDGSITDNDVDKEKFNKLNIHTLGIYICKSYEDTLEWLFESQSYTMISGNDGKSAATKLMKREFTLNMYNTQWVVEKDSLLKYFDKAIVKDNVIDVMEEIINQGFRL